MVSLRRVWLRTTPMSSRSGKNTGSSGTPASMMRADHAPATARCSSQRSLRRCWCPRCRRRRKRLRDPPGSTSNLSTFACLMWLKTDDVIFFPAVQQHFLRLGVEDVLRNLQALDVVGNGPVELLAFDRDPVGLVERPDDFLVASSARVLAGRSWPGTSACGRYARRECSLRFRTRTPPTNRDTE